MKETTKIAIFKGKKIRKTLHHNEWWFSVIDIIEALTDSLNPNDYKKLKEDAKEGGEIAGIARRKLEKRLGNSIVSKSNFLSRRNTEKLLNK